MQGSRKLYDVTVPIRSGMPVYEGDPEVRITRTASIADGAMANVSRLDLGAHTGTHIDAPVHFRDGAPGIDGLPLDLLIGQAQVLDATRFDTHLDADAVASLGIAPGIERVLFKTKNSRLWERKAFSPDFIALAESGASELIRRGVRLAGIDYLSIAPADDPAPVHHALLDAGVVVVEGLDLRDIVAGAYELICLPLCIVDADGAPARVVLRELP